MSISCLYIVEYFVFRVMFTVKIVLVPVVRVFIDQQENYSPRSYSYDHIIIIIIVIIRRGRVGECRRLQSPDYSLPC